MKGPITMLCFWVLTSICGFHTRRFRILVFIHKSKAKSSFFFFFFKKSVGMSAMDVEATDAFFDLTTVDTQLMNKDVFHRDLN